MHQSLNIEDAVLAQYCQKQHIRRLALFGSHLKGIAGPNSEIDLLVEFDPTQIPWLIGIIEMEIEWSELLGQKVDLRTAADLSRYFRNEVPALLPKLQELTSVG